MSFENQIKIAIADDHKIFRDGIKMALSDKPNLKMLWEAEDGKDMIHKIGIKKPDVLLMDIRMPGVDGLAATRRITSDPQLAGVRIVILTTFDLDEYVFEALRDGASGFLVKDTRPAELIQAVRVVAQGDALLSPGVTRRLVARFAAHAKAPPAVMGLETLTDREREVVTLVAEGLSNQEIAERLVVSPLTAKTHVSRAMVKLQVRDRAQLVMLAYETGLVRPGWLV